MNIKIDLIDPPESRIREEAEDNGIEELAESIKTLGLINPIQVKEVNGRYEIIAGERRVLACKKIGGELIRADIINGEEKEGEAIKIAENVLRKDLNPIELGKALLKLNNKYGVSYKRIGESLGKNTKWIQRKIELLKLPLDLLKAVRDKSINEAVARELAKVVEREKREELLYYAVYNGATLKVVELWVKDWMLKKGSRKRGIENVSGTEETEEGSYSLTMCILCGERGKMIEMRYEPCHKMCYYELMMEAERRRIEEGEKEKDKEGFKENELEIINRLCREKGWSVAKKEVRENEEIIEIRIKNKDEGVDIV